MSERKERFTRGPWVLTYRQSRLGFAMDIDGGPDGDWVARLGMTDESEVGRANAALLLAAPEMYETLKRLQRGHTYGNATWQIIENVLRKARGEVKP